MRWLILMPLVAVLALPGCAGRADSPGRGRDWTGVYPFEPAAMRIYPLTHLERASSGSPHIVCHIEFTDRWFDTVKALGTIELQLFKSAGGLSPGMDVQTARWEFDLKDLSRNAEWFDPITRTYRVQLDLPNWAEVGGQARLRAMFTPAAAQGVDAVLRDDFTLRL